MKRPLCETDQLIQLARTLNRPAPYIDCQYFIVRCPKCNGRLHAAMTRTGPRFLCDCKEVESPESKNTIALSALDSPLSALDSLSKKGA